MNGAILLLILSALAEEGAPPEVAIEKPMIIANYYTWYTTGHGPHKKWGSWGSEKASDFCPNGTNPDKFIFPPHLRDISSSAYPLIGPYDSDDPEVVRWHIRLAKAAGIDAFFVDWWGAATWQHPAGYTHDVFVKVVLPIAEEEGFKVCLFDETAQFYEDFETVKEWAAQYLAAYKDSPAYLHIDGKPVYGIYQVPFDPRLTPDQATELRDYVEARVGPVYWVIDKIANQDNPDTGRQEFVIPEEWLALDWVNAYMAYGTFSVQRIHTYADLAPQYAGMAAPAKKRGKAVMLPIHPGLDNSRLQEGSYIIPRENGDTLRGYIQAAIEAGADALILTSFNEWPETTNVEPALTWDDPYCYLRVLAEWKGRTFAPPPTPRDRVVLRPDLDGPDPVHTIAFNVVPESRWFQDDPSSYDKSFFRELIETFGASTDSGLRVGLSCIFSILETPPEVLQESIRAVLQSSEETGVPILINLDGQNWWRTRSDLWNWWDPALPGYDPQNAHNVEWTDWGPESAVKIAWRNWGNQIRVHPAQNILSPRVLEEHRERLEVLLPVIVEWFDALPAEKKDLLLGVKVGWEASIGYNAYHYPDGNQILEAAPDDPSGDPVEGPLSEPILSGGMAQLGFAAVSTGGIRTSGILTRDDIGEAVRRYLTFLSKLVAESGIPHDRIYTHQGGTYPPWDVHIPFWPAFNEYALPGWSFYFLDPAEAGTLSETLVEQGDPRWAAVEWWWPAATVDGWKDHIRRTFRFKECQFLCVYNWNQNGFLRHPEGIEAVRQLLVEGLES